MKLPAMVPRPITNPKLFLIEFGEDGFNAYTVDGDARNRRIFASSSVASTFCKVMSDIASTGTGRRIEFGLVDTKEEPCTT